MTVGRRSTDSSLTECPMMSRSVVTDAMQRRTRLLARSRRFKSHFFTHFKTRTIIKTKATKTSRLFCYFRNLKLIAQIAQCINDAFFDVSFSTSVYASKCAHMDVLFQQFHGSDTLNPAWGDSLIPSLIKRSTVCGGAPPGRWDIHALRPRTNIMAAFQATTMRLWKANYGSTMIINALLHSNFRQTDPTAVPSASAVMTVTRTL